jgi:hypothetical protein
MAVVFGATAFVFLFAFPGARDAPAGSGPPEMRKLVTAQASFVVYAPVGWTAQEAMHPGFRTLVISDPGGQREAALFTGTSPTGGDLVALARRFAGGIGRQFPDFAITSAFVSRDRTRVVVDGTYTHPARGGREMRSWLTGKDGAFVYTSIEAPQGRLAAERRLLLTILANVTVTKGTSFGGVPPVSRPLVDYRLRDGSAAFRIPRDWRVTDLGQGQFIALGPDTRFSFSVTAAQVATPQLGVRVPGMPVSPVLPPHRALAFLAQNAGIASDWRFEGVTPREDLAREIRRVYTAGSVDVEEFVHTSVSQGRPCKGYTVGITFGSRLGVNWSFRQISVGAGRGEFEDWVPTFVAMLQSYRIDEAWARRYVESGMARLRQLQRETSEMVARNAQEIHSMMQAAYDERQKSQAWIDYNRTSYIRGTQDWVSSAEGGTIYHSDRWGTRNTATGESWEGQPFNYFNFGGSNPKYAEQMTPIDRRDLFEKHIAK